MDHESFFGLFPVGFLIPILAIFMPVAIVGIVFWHKARERELEAHKEMRMREMEHQMKMKQLELEIEKAKAAKRSEEHTSELQSRGHLVCRLLLEKKKNINDFTSFIYGNM